MQKNEQWVVWGLSIPIGGGLKIGCALLGVWYYPMGLFSASVYGGWCGVWLSPLGWFGDDLLWVYSSKYHAKQN